MLSNQAACAAFKVASLVTDSSATVAASVAAAVAEFCAQSGLAAKQLKIKRQLSVAIEFLLLCLLFLVLPFMLLLLLLSLLLMFVVDLSTVALEDGFVASFPRSGNAAREQSAQ